MTTKPYDIVLRGGTVATASAVFPADVAIDGETIVAVGRNLGPGVQDIDVRGKLVLPGGIDSHAHIEQVSAAGILNADTFESATVVSGTKRKPNPTPWTMIAAMMSRCPLSSVRWLIW